MSTATKVLILDMLEGFTTSPVTADTVRVYAKVVEACSLEAVKMAADEFAAGLAPNMAVHRPPTSAEFAARVRLIDDALSMRKALGERPALPPPPKLVIDHAMRERASKLLTKLAGDMRGKLDRETRESDGRVFRGGSAEERGDPRPLAERLRLTA